MRRIIAIATLSLATLSLTLLPGTESSNAQQAKSCPQADQCRVECGQAHTACRAKVTNPIFVCNNAKSACLNRCNVIQAKGCRQTAPDRPR